MVQMRLDAFRTASDGDGGPERGGGGGAVPRAADAEEERWEMGVRCGGLEEKIEGVQEEFGG